MTELNRGVAVDAQGYFVGAFTWPAGTPSPKLNSKGTPKAEQLKLLLTEAALAVPSEKARWDFATETWSLPTERFFVVDEATGRKVSGSLQWRERLPGLRPGLVYVEVPPPAATSRKPLWNSEARAWEFPRRVALIDEDGLCANVALENPMTTTPDVEVPAGWEREDDSSGALPTDVDGQPIQIGTIKVAAGNFAFCGFTIPKQRLETVLTNQNLTTQWQAHLEAEGLWELWQTLADDFQVPLAAKDKLIIKFAKAQGYSRQQIVDFIRNQLRG